MSNTTTDRMNLMLLKNDDAASFMLPKALKKLVNKKAKEARLDFSKYTKIALIEKIERESV